MTSPGSWLEVAELGAGVDFGAGGEFSGGDGGWLLHGFLDGAGDEVAGAQAYGECEGEDDAPEEDAEGEFHYGAAYVEVVKRHGCGEDVYQPLDAHGEKARVV